MKAVLGIEIGAFGNAATITLLNLSLVLSLGSLSATPIGQSAVATAVVAAFIATTLGGLLVALFARAPAEIAGAASSTTMIYAALAAELVARAGPQANLAEIWAALSLTVMLAGIFVAIAGCARLAGAIKFMPTPVNAGFVTGLGLLVVWSQIAPLLGLEGRVSSYPLSDVIELTKSGSVAVGAVTALTMWSCPKITRRVPPALAALAVGTALYYLVGWIYGADVLGPTLGRIAPAATAEATISAVWTFVHPSWFFSTALHVAPYAAFLAFQIVMNGALGAAGVGALLGARSDVDRTLRTQGWINVVCGALGSLPVTTIGSIALQAARMKPVTPTVAALSCGILFFGVVLAGDLLTRIPVAVLAGILIMGGVAMVDRWAIGLISSLRRGSGSRSPVLWNLVIVGAVAAAFFFGSVPLALFIGAVLAMVLLALSLSKATTFESSDGNGLASTRVWPVEQAQWLAEQRYRIAVFRPRGSVFFGTADQLATHLDNLEGGIRYCVLDLSRLTTLDATGCQLIAASAKKLDAKGVATVLAGLSATSARGNELITLGLVHPNPQTRWFGDLDRALEWVESELLRERWSDMPGGTGVDLADTPLTADLSASELVELRQSFERLEVPAGPLFKRGEPGASLFVINRGFVEIRIGDERAGQETRLAAFGPGSMFGEIALLNADRRSADAVCIEPTLLYELRRATLMQLAERSPALYARVIENLNRHLANRLIIATATVQVYR